MSCPRCKAPDPTSPGTTNCPRCGEPRPPDPLIGTDVAGRFRVEALIGQGGMGKVYRARHNALSKTICLKVLKPALLEDPTLVGRFEREAQAASRLNHANAIQVIDFGRVSPDGTLFIAMEFVQGKDLRLILRDEGPLSEKRIQHIVAQVLAALAEAHVRNVIHRDLKPENIMVEQRLDESDFVKVLDFGIAKILDADLPSLTRTDVVCGTPQYMAPEQATGSTLDARCDLYAVGVILYQLATGSLPFDGQNSMEILTRHVNELPEAPTARTPSARISPALEALILKAMEKDPNDRPQTAHDFRRLLLELEQQPTPANGTNPVLSSHAQATPARAQPHTSFQRPSNRGKSKPGEKKKDAAARRKLYGAGAAVALVAGSLALLAIKRPGVVQEVPGTAALTTGGGLAAPGGGAAGATGAAGASGASGLSKLPNSITLPPRDPAQAGQLVERAHQLQRDGDTGSARDLLEQAITLDPDNARAHYSLGSLYWLTQPDRARSEYDRAVQLDPGTYAQQVKSIEAQLPPARAQR